MSRLTVSALLAFVVLAIGIPNHDGSVLAQESPSRDRPLRGSRVAPVERIEDDGTVVVKSDAGERHVALLGVEWPEDEAAAAAAQEFLERLLLGESVFVDGPGDNAAASKPADEDDKPRPAYLHRAPDRLFVNIEVLRLGYARVSAKPAFAQLADFREAEKKARDTGKGVWAENGNGRAREVRRTRTAPDDKAREAAPRPPAGGADTVYVTPSGKKYHRSDCRFAANGRPISLQEAGQKGYQPCSRCKPPAR